RVGDALRLAPDALHQALLGRELLDLDVVTETLFDAFLDVLAGAEFVDEPVLDRVGSEIDPSFGLADRLLVEPAALGDVLDERLVVVVDEPLEIFVVLLFGLLERVASVLVLAGGLRAVVESELVGQSLRVDRRTAHADAPDDARLARPELVTAGSDPVTAARTGVGRVADRRAVEALGRQTDVLARQHLAAGRVEF